MRRLAQILQLIRVSAACAVLLALGFSLPSAAHSFAGHHEYAAAAHSAAGTGGAAAHSDAHDSAHAPAQGSIQDSQHEPQSAEAANCCAGACMAVGILSLEPGEIALAQPARWKQQDSQLPSREQLALLRPPKA